MLAINVKDVQQRRPLPKSKYEPRYYDSRGQPLFELRGRHWRVWDWCIWDLCCTRGERVFCLCCACGRDQPDDWSWCAEGPSWFALGTLLSTALIALCLALVVVVPEQQQLARPLPPAPSWVAPPPFFASRNCSWRAEVRTLWPPVCQRSCGCQACRPGSDPVCQPYVAADRCCAGGDNTTCCAQRCATCARLDPVTLARPCHCVDGPGTPTCVRCDPQQLQLAPPACLDTCSEPGVLRVTWSCNCSCVATAATELCSTRCLDRHSIALSFVSSNVVLTANFSAGRPASLVASLYNASCGTGPLAPCWLGLVSNHALVGAPRRGLVPNGTLVSATQPCWWWANSSATLARSPLTYIDPSGGLVYWNDSTTPQPWLPPTPPPPRPVSRAALVLTWLFGIVASLALLVTALTCFLCCCWGTEQRTVKVPILGIRAVRGTKLPAGCQELILDFVYGPRNPRGKPARG